jgi:predicted HicB family RNase H-like nuclease
MAKRKWGVAMMNLMKINNIDAVIKYDPEIEMFRGEFVEPNGGG